MSPYLEWVANGVTAVSIVLAGRNSEHTWWTGILASLLFAWLFYAAQLYADVTLQGFFVGSSLHGWWRWRQGLSAKTLSVTRVAWPTLAWALPAALLVTLVYGTLLHVYTDAYAPFADSAVLAFSVMAQLLLMHRHLETWPCWLLVNVLSVPLYASRGLSLTAVLYALYGIHACIAWWYWQRINRTRHT